MTNYTDGITLAAMQGIEPVRPYWDVVYDDYSTYVVVDESNPYPDGIELYNYKHSRSVVVDYANLFRDGLVFDNYDYSNPADEAAIAARFASNYYPSHADTFDDFASYADDLAARHHAPAAVAQSTCGPRGPEVVCSESQPVARSHARPRCRLVRHTITTHGPPAAPSLTTTGSLLAA